MDYPKFEFVKEEPSGYIYAGDEKLEIFPVFIGLLNSSDIIEEFDFTWLRKMHIFFEENARLSFSQYNILVCVYNKFCRKDHEHRRMTAKYSEFVESDEKIISVKFA